MRQLAFCLACIVAMALSSGAGRAQEGHPLVGSWHGTWGPNTKDRTDVTFVISYDGKLIHVVLNPGFDTVKMQRAELDPNNWTVHFEGDMKDRDGKSVHLTIDGKLENITSARRSLFGTWVQGQTKGDFRVRRDN